ncbi:MAG: response regulator, partial [Proteobacteria bacterium]|nr:response regulator [Pseudomonadota bacterium]
MTARILVVDDEPDLESLVVQRFRRQIRDGRFSFVFAHDGVDALSQLQGEHGIDMVITDINMPRMDGLTLLSRLAERDERLATIVVSAYGDLANIRTAMNRGAFDFLTKPIDFADFETTIGKTLQSVELTRDYQRRQVQAEQARAQLLRYFSPNLAARLADQSSSDIDLGVQRRDVTAMFTDIAGFTTLSERMDPALIAPVLNDYVTGTSDIIFDHDGTLLQTRGDGLYVLFGAPSDQPDHAARALECALAIDAYTQELRARWAAKGIELGATRIGLNAGPAVCGNFGSGRYFYYNALGDTINTAARLEQANKPLGTRICVAESVVQRCADFQGRPVGLLTLRGRSEALRAFEPLRPERYASDLTAAYLQAFEKAEAGDPAAVPAFASLLGRD